MGLGIDEERIFSDFLALWILRRGFMPMPQFLQLKNETFCYLLGVCNEIIFWYLMPLETEEVRLELDRFVERKISRFLSLRSFFFGTGDRSPESSRLYSENCSFINQRCSNLLDKLEIPDSLTSEAYLGLLICELFFSHCKTFSSIKINCPSLF